MSVIAEQPLDQIDIGNLDLWSDGPPHEIFARLRREAPVHWSPLADYPDEGGFWSITRAEDVRAISLDWKTYSSYVGGCLVLDDIGIPLEVMQQQMISMDPPRHDRLKALFQRGFTPKRIAEHEDRVRGSSTASSTGSASAASATSCTKSRAGRRPRDRLLHRQPGGGRPQARRAHEHRARIRRPGPAALG